MQQPTVSSLARDMKFEGFLLVRSADQRTSSNGSKYLDMTLESIGSGRKIILGIADTTPPEAKLDRIMKIASKCKEFGPIQ